ncbi:MAG: DNA methyltransferase [Chloroflexi bacterium]|nr:MAG: DNA methyltransferase [Chloroflexota bacterium]
MRSGDPIPSAPESFNQQDVRETTREMAVQTRPSGSIVKSLNVRPVAGSIVRDIIQRRHYLHAMPSAPSACFGVYLSGELHGAVVFTPGARLGHRLLRGAHPAHVVTLARVWLSDDLPKNSESRVLGIVLRTVRHSTPWKLILSYADPAAGHAGIIYRASGWHDLGQTEPSAYIDLGDGRLHHPRTVFTWFGTNSIPHLRATGVPARRVHVPGKHRFAYVLDPTWRWRLG